MRPCPCAHLRQHGLHHPDHPEQVDAEDLLVLCDRELLGGASGSDAGVVDQDVQSTEAADHVLDRGSHGGITRDIEVHESQAIDGGESRRVAAGADHLETGVDEAKSRLLTDALGGACHECHWLLWIHGELLAVVICRL